MMNPLDRFTVEILESMIQSDHAQTGDVSVLAKIALAAKQAKPTAWRVGGYLSNNKSWAERASAEENYLLEPLYDHPLITGIDEDHHDPELEPGLYLAEIMTKGGAACINGKFTTSPAPQLPDGMVLMPLDMLHDYRDVKNAEVENAKILAKGREGSRWERDFKNLQAELEAIDIMLAAAPEPE